MDVEKCIGVNELKEVTNPIYLDKGRYPTPDGLFSYEIFGRPGSYDRKTLFAYIDLKDYFLHPLVYKNLISLNRKIEEIISGIGYFKIDKDTGKLIKSTEEEGGQTGIDFLYKHWNTIVFDTTESNKRDERVDFFKAVKKKEAFMRYQIIIPAFYRDINMSSSDSGVLKHEKINDYYAKILRLTKALEENMNSGIDFVFNSTKASIQSYLVEIFDFCIGLAKGKNGIFRQSVMGKSIDYASRNVISEAIYTDAERYTDLMVDYTHSGVPMATVLSIFNPFVIKWCQDFFHNQLNTINNKEIKGTDKTVLMASNIMDDFNHDAIKKKINLFIKAPEERFEPIGIRLEDGSTKYLYYHGSHVPPTDDRNNDSTISTRRLTWCDIFYMACVDVVKDKHVYITRYPIEDYFNIYPSKVSVLSTFKTKPQYIEGKYYPYYPIIDEKADKQVIRGLFIDSLQPFNCYLKGLGGDFDGDMITIRGVFTQEANKEAEEIIYSKSNVINIKGNNNRPISMECVQSIYDFTKE